MTTSIFISGLGQLLNKKYILVEKRELVSHLYLIKYKMKYEIDNLMETGKTYKSIIKDMISISRETAKRYCLIFKENAIYKLKQNLWRKKILAIMFVLIFTIGNSLITAHYLTSFSFELKNDIFSYIGFIILSIFGITIINAKWIKIVAEKYADRF